MRKIIPFIVLLILVVLPMIASAQIKECCILSRTITIGDETCNKGEVVGPNTTACDDCSTTATKCTYVADPTAVPPEPDWNNWGTFCMINTLYRVTDWISYLLFAIVGVMIIVGAFEIVTAGGSPEKVTSGRNYILYAVIGLVVAFFAKAIPALVKAMVGM